MAFDHRASFVRDLFKIQGAPTADDRARVSDAKRLIYEAVLEAISQGAPRESAGVLVDEEYGTEVARSARDAGLLLAMPVEKSGQAEFDFDYGEAWPEHLAGFEPTFAKVLVRYNPEGDPEANAHQVQRLAELSSGLDRARQAFLFELLVPPTPAQSETFHDDQARYDVELRPRLVLETIGAMHAGGVEPDIWKIEGLDHPADCEAVLARARSGGREVDCIVLGRGTAEAKLDHWLRVGSAAGFSGFAVGRTIWLDALGKLTAGRWGRQQAVEAIARNYLEAIEVFDGAA